MPNYEVSATASFVVKAESQEAAGLMVEDWWQSHRAGDSVTPRHWHIGSSKAAGTGRGSGPGRQIQELMTRGREKFTLDAASVKLIEEAEHEFEDV
jgi:hypothetical protein